MTKTKSLIPVNIKSADFGPLIFRTKDKDLHFYQHYGIMPDMGDEHHNLYFIEEGEECKEGDICLWNIQHDYIVAIAESNNALMHHKIIATTDEALIEKGVPEIPEEYVKHYAYKAGDLNSVDIEMDSIYVEPVGMHSNRGDFIEIPKLKDLKEVIIYHEPAPMVDWNEFTMTQFIEHLEEEFKFSSTGTAKSIFELISAYKEMKEGLKSIRKEYVENVNEEDSITDKLNKLIGDE